LEATHLFSKSPFAPSLYPIDETARISTPTFADIIIAQAGCPDFTPIIAYLRDGTLPQDVKQARRIVAESQDFVS
jgi:hypothetical protein